MWIAESGGVPILQAGEGELEFVAVEIDCGVCFYYGRAIGDFGGGFERHIAGSGEGALGGCGDALAVDSVSSRDSSASGLSCWYPSGQSDPPRKAESMMCAA